MSTDRAAAFERLFQAAEKQSRGFVPFPEHLRSLENRSIFSSTLAQVQAQNHQSEKFLLSNNNNINTTSSTTGPSSTSSSSFEKNRRETEKSAHDFCASRVPNLAENLDRATAALEAAQESQSDVEAMLTRVDKMTDVTKTVREYSERMSSNASALIAKRAKAEGVLNGLSDRLKKFQKVDSLHDEAIAATKYIATTSRFVSMLDEIEDAASFLAEVPHFKQSAQVYSTRLSIAYQRSMSALRDHCCDALREAAKRVSGSDLMKKVLIVNSANNNNNNKPLFPPPPLSTSTSSSIVGSTVGETENNNEQQAQESKKPSTSSSSLPPRPEKLCDALNLVDAEFTAFLESSETAFRLIEARIGAKEAEQFVMDVFSSYTDARLQLVEPLLIEYSSINNNNASSTTLNKTQSSSSSSSSTSSFNATSFVHNIVETCIAEANLFQKMWISDLSSSYLRGPLEAFVSAGYEIFRSKLLALDAVGQLCSLSFTLNDIQKKLHAAAKQHHSHNHNNNQKIESSNNNNHNQQLVSSVALRNELIANAVSRFIQDTDERLMFRVSIYLRNGLCAPANIFIKSTSSAPPPPAAATTTTTIPIASWIFEKATEAIFAKIFKSSSSSSSSAIENFGAPQSIDIPTPFSAPFCIGSVIRLRWLCAQLKKSASGAAAFAPFLEEATNAVIVDITEILRTSWTSSSSARIANLSTTLFASLEQPESEGTPNAKETFLAAVASLLPFALGLRQLLFTREALLSVGARLATVEASISFSSMQISKVEMEVPKVVEAPFRKLSDGAIQALIGCVVRDKNSGEKALQYLASVLQVCLDQSVATQHLVWRAAIPLALDKIFVEGNDEQKEEMKNKWNAML